MTNKIIPSPGYKVHHVEDAGLTGFISYHRLMTVLMEVGEIKSDEKLIGLILEETGIKLKVEHSLNSNK